jgi:hypothetical protein
MKKYIPLLIIAASFLMCCHHPANENALVKARGQDVIVMAVDSELMKVSELSPAELRDDSTLADGTIPASWKTAHINDVKGLKLFIKQLQQWVITNDREMLAAAVQYPLDDVIKTRESLIVNFDNVFTKAVKLSLATTNFNQLFRNERGVMLDGGKIWLAQKGDNFKIISINYEPSK